MQIYSENERMRHPQAKLIPQYVWSEICKNTISDAQVELMSIPQGELLVRLIRLKNNLSNQEKLKELFFCAYRVPVIHEGFLREMCHAIELPRPQQFILAASTGHIDFFTDVLASADVGEEFYPRAFLFAASNGHLKVIQELARLAPTRVQDMIEAESFGAFREAASSGHLGVIQELARLAPTRRVREMIEAWSFWAFRKAARNGHLEVMKELMRLAPTCVQRMITAESFGAFREAAENGHLGVMNELMRLAPTCVQDMIAAESFGAFRAAAMNGHLGVVSELAHLAPTRVQEMIAARSFCAFEGAAMNGHLEVVSELARLAPTRVQEMIASGYFEALRSVVLNEHTSLINKLLTFPSALAHAEMHQDEYGQYVRPFIEKKLEHFRRRHAAGHPSLVITQQEATSCFFMLRHLMRETPSSADSLEKIDFLMAIPAVKSLLHRAINQGMENELLRNALRLNNRVLVERLLAVPAVNELARRNNLYPAETHGNLNLQELSDNAESSMMALSGLEEKMLKRLEAKYKPAIDKKGVTEAFNEVYQSIIERYRKNPIVFTKDNGESLQLLLTKDEFERLANERHFSEAEKERANKGYYQHPTHTLYRYLTKGNPWMHPGASYVEIDNITGAGSSDFGRYKGLITLLWTAASDASERGTDGFTSETRLEEMILQIGRGIGRAHNWDKPRRPAHNADGTPRLDSHGKPYMEQFDDLEGDRPSCSSGVRRRLFQSLMGHPLYRQDIRPVIASVFRDKIRDTMKDSISSASTEFLEALLVDYARITQGEIMDEMSLVLSCQFDIPEEAIEGWCQALHQQYDVVFGSEEVEASIAEAKKTFFAQSRHLGQFLASVESCQLLPLCQERLQQRQDDLISRLEALPSSERFQFLSEEDDVTGLSRLLHAIHLGVLGGVGMRVTSDEFLKLLAPDEEVKKAVIEVLTNYGNDGRLSDWLSALPAASRTDFMSRISDEYKALQSPSPSSDSDSDSAAPSPSDDGPITSPSVAFESLPDDPSGQLLEEFEQNEQHQAINHAASYRQTVTALRPQDEDSGPGDAPRRTPR